MKRWQNKERSELSDQKLWEAVKKTATPLKRERNAEILTPARVQREASKSTKVPSVPRTKPTSKIEPADKLPQDLTRRERWSLQQGRSKLDRTLDLHGMTQEQAYNFLARALEEAIKANCRRILVITGKGSRPGAGTSGPGKIGVLRAQVPLWLRDGPLSHYVSKTASAGTIHGGEGALYVFLRRRKRLDK